MSFPFVFNPVTGLNDTTQFPDDDPQIRVHLQNLLNQARDFINTDVQNQLNLIPYNSTYRQAIINGNFDIWQRGTSFSFPANTSVNPYTADRWFITKTWGDALTVTRQPFTVAQSEVPNNPKFFIRGTYISGTGKSMNIVQKIEGLPFLGKNVTISFWAKSNTVNPINILLGQVYSGSQQDSMLTQSVSTTTSWKQYTLTFTLPSGSGMTVDDNLANTSLIFQGGFTNANDYIDIAQVQMNIGSIALPFIPKSYAEELRNCQRYYYRLGSDNGAWTKFGNGMCITSGTAYILINFLSKMRVAPTMNNSSGFCLMSSSGSALSVTGIVVDSISDSYCTLNVTSSGLTVGNATMLSSYNSTSSWIEFISEL
ncbi:MAG: carbohydrate binding domain-containing protein [Bacillota bacterium]|nr:carbohydrate binding domain-containing protein [Bacillota bacterium]